MNDENRLLREYAESGRTEPFSRIVRQYSALVYGTALRITGNRDDAEEIAQECFLTLARRPHDVRTSLAGWLHAAATSRSRNLLRHRDRQRRHERQAAMEQHDQADPTWRQIAPHLDHALDRMPENLRLPLVMHFLQGRTQDQIAERLGTSQSTVSRRIERALAELRDQLQKSGAVVTTGLLAVLLSKQAAVAAPASLNATLTALAGSGLTGAAAGTAALTTAATAAGLSAAGPKLFALVAVGMFIISGHQALHSMTHSTKEQTLNASARHEGNKTWIPNVDRLEFGRGQDNQFIAALAATLKAMGKQTPYHELMGFSAAAFRFQFFIPEFCPSSPDLLLTFDHAEPALSAVGLRAECIETIAMSDDQCRALRNQIAQSIEAGRPVVAENLMGRGSYGIVTGYVEPDKQFLCRTYRDRSDDYATATDWPSKLCLIDGPTAAPSRSESAIRSLRIAVELATTDRTDWNGRSQASGFAAFEKWRDELRNDARLDALDPETSAYYAAANGWIHYALLDARRSAVQYLHAVADELNPSAGPHLTAAAQTYQAIVAKLEAASTHVAIPWIADAAPDRWSKNDRHAQAALVDEVLTLERQAIAQIEQALAACATLPANVVRDADRTLITNAERLRRDPQRTNAFFIAMETALKTMGEDAQYDDLMGHSAYAFRIQFHPDRWCDSPPCPICGSDSAAAALAAFGFRQTTCMAEDEHSPDADAARKTIAAEINDGRPVIALFEDWGLIVGYSDAGRQFLRLNDTDAASQTAIAQKWPWLTMMLERTGAKPQRRQTIARSLKLAAEQMRTPNVAGFLSGDAAWRQWIAELTNAQRLAAMDASALADAARCNRCTLDSLIDARQAAVRYLQSIAADTDPETSTHLRSAIASYQELLTILTDATRHLPAPNQPWTAEMRQAQAETLRQAPDLDTRAVSQLEKALNAMTEP